MKRILVLLLLLILVSAGAYFLISGEDEKTTLTKNDRDFRIENIEDVHLIKIRTRRRPELHLSKSGNDWLINYKHAASPNAVGRLLEVMQDLRMDYIPHNNALKNIKDEMELIGLHVEAFDKEGKKMKGYWVGGGTSDERGTYFQMEGSNQPYVMEMASFVGSLRSRYIPSAKQWRDRRFLNEDISKFKSVKVEYPKSQDDSFVIDVAAGTVEPLSELSLKTKGKIKPGAIKAYLKSFESIGAEAIENDHKERDSIAQLVPFAKFTLEYQNGETKWFNMFPLKDLEFQDVNTTSTAQTARIERYMTDCSWGDFLMVQHLLVKKLLRPLDFFYV